MDRRFRAIDGQPPSHAPQPRQSYFTRQAIRAGYMDPRVERPPDYFWNPRDMHEALHRELEKERIREEIIAGEIARRRILEAEVRRELMMERELAMRSRGEGGLSFSLMAGYEPRFPLLPHQRGDGRPFEDRTMSGEQRLMRHDNGVQGLETQPFQRPSLERFEMVPFQQRSIDAAKISQSQQWSIDAAKISESQQRSIKTKISEFQERSTEPKIAEVKISETNPVLASSQEEQKIVAKPLVNISGLKRKAMSPPAVSVNELPSASIPKKKVREEWSCAICQVSSNSEKALKSHLRGKKHKKCEARLRAHGTGKSCTIGLFPKKTNILFEKSCKEDVKLSREGQQLSNSGSKLSLIVSETETGKNDFGGPSTKFDLDLDITTSKAATAAPPATGANKKCRFWCEMCKVGTFSEKVMNTHKKGKKHIFRLQRVNHTDGPLPTISTNQATFDVDQTAHAILTTSISTTSVVQALDVSSSNETAKDEPNRTLEMVAKAMDEVKSGDASDAKATIEAISEDAPSGN